MSQLTYASIDQTILNTLTPPKKSYWGLIFILFVGVLIGAACWGYQIFVGIGVGGQNNPVAWGTYLINFVFWVGIAHSGTLISAILHLFRAGWRNPIARAAETMTVFAVSIAGLFPFIHLGRIWLVYYMLPYPNQRYLWPNFQSPLVFDVVAISTYLTVSSLFWYTGMLPDLAIIRDRATGFRKKVFSVIAMGWTGEFEQWRHYARGYLFFAALATPLVISVHSVVSWDFAMSIVPGWHATVFAPYFVAGAIFSGFAMVLTVMIPVRRIFGLEAYITNYHFENMSRFLLLTSTIVGYAYASEYFVAWYSGVEAEQSSFWLRAFGPYWISTWVMILCNGVFPQLLWFKKLRTNLPFLFILSVLINIGMWFERYVIIITGLSREYDPAVWGVYTPSAAELTIVAGSFGFFSMLFLVFLKLFPVVAIAEVKEIAIHERMHDEGAH